MANTDAATKAKADVEKALASVIGKEWPGVFLVYASRDEGIQKADEDKFAELMDGSAKTLAAEIRDNSFDRLDARTRKSEGGFGLDEIFTDLAGEENAQSAKEEFTKIIAGAVEEYGGAAVAGYRSEGKFGIWHNMCRKAQKTARKTRFSQATYDKILHDGADKIYSKALNVMASHIGNL